MAASFEPRIEALGHGTQRIRIDSEGRTLTYRDVLHLWQADAAFRSLFISILAGVECRAYRWETPPLTLATSARAFEFVILDSPWLDIPPEPAVFAEHFRRSSGDDIAVFPNLAGESLLVVPEPRGPDSVYAHLAAFSRAAPPAQNHALWRVVGRCMSERLQDRPTWLSTAGGGVSWLHVRLDPRPKYYGHRPYAEETEMLR